ncbi:Acetyltransferase (GNAT) family protein [Pseudomonas chlororaphis]|uniref:GNAT family N-acetyltransferase n=1 Tax=Pseudomonas chlororaphis TaxID=587753 RepID=UPI0008793829|nr:GNAT family N-acetyltransferase [Pseudomonas chlororaphis]WDH06745.1 GNAT family N-acetyltransferase [Pseudomonas chlororaphis]WDH10501.1 GNAT family N-acetyltransferase [Pseudomonas chlororaphis]SDT30305.1 Acetyltransferase (GNAT) family protein [Pseudomonas chlororaphis]
MSHDNRQLWVGCSPSRQTATSQSELAIRQISALPPEILVLEAEAVAEGFRFLTRLVADWKSGANRFDQPGECLLGAFRDGHLIAIGGLSYDPYAGPDIGRLRRVYVARAVRGQSVGKALVQRLLEYAAQRFSVVRLSTDTPEGAAFYLRCGFQPIQDDFATHVKSLADAR